MYKNSETEILLKILHKYKNFQHNTSIIKYNFIIDLYNTFPYTFKITYTSKEKNNKQYNNVPLIKLKNSKKKIDINNIYFLINDKFKTDIETLLIYQIDNISTIFNGIVINMENYNIICFPEKNYIFSRFNTLKKYNDGDINYEYKIYKLYDGTQVNYYFNNILNMWVLSTQNIININNKIIDCLNNDSFLSFFNKMIENLMIDISNLNKNYTYIFFLINKNYNLSNKKNKLKFICSINNKTGLDDFDVNNSYNNSTIIINTELSNGDDNTKININNPWRCKAALRGGGGWRKRCNSTVERGGSPSTNPEAVTGCDECVGWPIGRNAAAPLAAAPLRTLPRPTPLLVQSHTHPATDNCIYYDNKKSHPVLRKVDVIYNQCHDDGHGGGVSLQGKVEGAGARLLAGPVESGATSHHAANPSNITAISIFTKIKIKQLYSLHSKTQYGLILRSNNNMENRLIYFDYYQKLKKIINIPIYNNIIDIKYICLRAIIKYKISKSDIYNNFSFMIKYYNYIMLEISNIVNIFISNFLDISKQNLNNTAIDDKYKSFIIIINNDIKENKIINDIFYNNYCLNNINNDDNIYKLTLRDFIFQKKYINYIYNIIF